MTVILATYIFVSEINVALYDRKLSKQFLVRVLELNVVDSLYAVDYVS